MCSKGPLVPVGVKQEKSQMETNVLQDIRLVCLGSPLMDITASVDDLFLQKYGLEPDNAYVVDENKRAIFDEIRIGSIEEIGGSVTNTVRTINALRKSPGGGVAYFGTVGDDHYGDVIKRRLQNEGLGDHLKTVRGGTGKVAVLLREKARTLVTDLGVSRTFFLDNSILEAAQLVYLSGFFISVSTDISQLLHNKIVAFNLGAPFLAKKFPEEMVRLYRNSSLVFGNETEFRALGGLHNTTSNDLKEVVLTINKIHDNRSRIVVVTRGSRSVLVLENNSWQEFEVPEVNPGEIVDSNGAGDAFVGGFLARYINGDSTASCVECGIKIAREIIQSVGFNVGKYIE